MHHDVSLLPGTIVTIPPTKCADCCATEGRVIKCDGEADLVECWVCGARWTEACPGAKK